MKTSGLPVRQYPLPVSLYEKKSPYEMLPSFITIHNTANRASAINEAKYVVHGSGEVSYHYAVDDKEAIQILPLYRNGWHAGDGRSGPGNRLSIGIEICYSIDEGDERYPIAEDNAAKLTAGLLLHFGWEIDRVKKHQDWSGKYCPHRMLDNDGWAPFLSKVAVYLNAVSTPEFVQRFYRVQVGAFSIKSNAERMKQELKDKGFAAFLQYNAEKNVWRVQVGAYKIRENADNMMRRLVDSGYKVLVKYE